MLLNALVQNVCEKLSSGTQEMNAMEPKIAKTQMVVHHSPPRLLLQMENKQATLFSTDLSASETTLCCDAQTVLLTRAYQKVLKYKSLVSTKFAKWSKLILTAVAVET
jgi:hypothetical protein